MLNLVSRLNQTNHPALISKTRQLTFKELHNRVAQTAAGLAAQGVQPGQRILLLMPMSIELYISLLALFWIDATVMLVDPSAPMNDIFGRFKPHGFIGSAKAHLLRLKFASLRGLPLYVSTGFVPLPHKRLHRIQAKPIPILEPEHPALLTFTTGTTGIPKAMARSHSFLLAQHHALAHHMDFKAGDVDLPTLPVFLLHSLAAGATCVLPDANLRNVGAINPQPILKQISSCSVTSMSGAPSFFNALCTPLLSERRSFPEVKKIFTGGGRVLSSDVDRIQQCFPNAKITIVYGSTEAEPIATLDASLHFDDLRAGEKNGKGAFVGQPVDEITIQVVNNELWVSGEHVNKAYYQSPEHDQENKVKDNNVIWHRTGDAAFLEGADIWLLGRIGDDIDGVWPMPIEGAVLQLPFVQQAALISYQNQAVLAISINSEPENWRRRIADLTPIPLIVCEAIPLDPRHNTKIDRKALRSLLLKSRHDLI